MQTTIDTLGDVIFEKREILKKLNEEREQLLKKLCGKQSSINLMEVLISQLSVERQSIIDQRLSHGRDTCNMVLTDKPATHNVKDYGDCEREQPKG